MSILKSHSLTRKFQDGLSPITSRGWCTLPRTTSPPPPPPSRRQVCLNLEQTHVMLPVPLHVTPSFRSELVELSWRLHFEFVTTTGGAAPVSAPADPSHHATWEAPDTLPIETMVWDLPVRLCPTSPGHVAQALHMAVTQTAAV